MESVVQLLAFILPIIAFASVVLILFVNLYLKVRRHFLVRVNCWFCNQWTKVLYDEQECFECPSCLQYNGFSSDGDYNKPIPAQHDELLNQPIPKNPHHYAPPPSNGLCHLCNNNQQLKIYQLANFIPLNEANYNVEIEHFQKQLEKAYKLCPPCQAMVKTTLNKQTCLLGFKLTQLRKKGMLLLDLNNSYNGISKQAKWSFLKNLVHCTLISFAVLNVLLILTETDFSDRNLKHSTPKWLFPYVLRLKGVSLAILNFCQDVYKQVLNTVGLNLLLENVSAIGHNFISRFLGVPLVEATLLHVNSTLVNFAQLAEPYYPLPELTKVENGILLCFVATLLQGILLLLNDESSFKRKSFHFAMWIVLGFVHWVQHPSKKHLSTYFTVIQLVSSTAIITSMLFRRNPKRFKLKKLKRISKRAPAEESQLGELSDNEEAYNSPFKASNTTTAIPKCSVQSKPIFGQPATFEDQFNNRQPFYDARSVATATESLNQSFVSAKTRLSDQISLPDTASIFSSSFLNHTPPSCRENDIDIDISLNKLHLSAPIIKKMPPINAFHTNSDVSRPRPVISPAKLKNVTQNSWVAGGFWRDSNGILMPLNSLTNLSRSSSQTSGFVSHTGPFEPNNFGSLPSSVNNSFCGDFECNSVFSEPAYYMNGSYVMQGRNVNRRFAGHADLHRTFYPVLNHEQLVYLTPCGFASKISPNKFPANLEKSSFVVPNSVMLDTSKAGSLFKDWMDKVDS